MSNVDDIHTRFCRYRCVGCGTVARLPVAWPPYDLACLACGEDTNPWVRCGSLAEYYGWTRRDDVCQVGQHVSSHPVREYLLAPPPCPRSPRAPAATGVVVRCCDSCADRLDSYRREHFATFSLASQEAP